MRTGMEIFYGSLHAYRGAFRQINLKMCNKCHVFKPSICILDFNHVSRTASTSRIRDCRPPHIPTVESEELRASRIRVDCWKRSLETDSMPMCVLSCWCIQSLCKINCEACIILVGNSFTVSGIAGILTLKAMGSCYFELFFCVIVR
jgi:hypothetical protein